MFEWHAIRTFGTVYALYILYKTKVNNESENRMIKNTKTVTIHNFTFEYIPSMRLMSVTSPTGGIEIHHNLSYEQANEIVGEILEKNMNCS